MKLLNTEYDIQIEFEENKSYVLCIESPSVYAQCVSSLWQQVSGQEGEWILSEKEKVLSIPKKVECVFNPWALDYNNKKAMTRLYKELENIIQEKYLDRMTKANSEIVNVLDCALSDVPYPLTMKYDYDITGLLKIYDVKFDIVDVTLLERITSFIKIMHQVCLIDVFIFIGLKTYMTLSDIEELYKMASYEKVSILLIESVTRPKLHSEVVKVVDQDMCIIDY